MITPYKNRVVDFGKPVKVYRNLTKACWSLKQGGVVVAHADQLLITSEKFKVNLKSRDKGLTESKKYVHAFIVGYLAVCQTTLTKTQKDLSIGYNPVYAGYFYLVRDGYKLPILSDCKINLKLQLTSTGKVLLSEGQDVINTLPVLSMN